MLNGEQRLLAAFWRCLKDDLAGRGCTSDSLRGTSRRLPYRERVTIERQQLQDDAQSFIYSEGFDWWAHQSGLDPYHLRMQFNATSDHRN